MTCDELEPLLHPFIDGELLAQDKAELEGHLLTCQACSQKANRERVAVDLIRSGAQTVQPKAPEALKLRLLDAIHKESAIARRRVVTRWAAAAAAAGIAVFFGQHEYQLLECRLEMDDAVGLHARQYPLDVKAKPRDLETMIAGQLGYNVHVPQIPNATATGARFIHVRGKDAVLIRYQLSGHSQPLSLIVAGDEPAHVSELEYDTARGYNTVTWHDGTVAYHLLTDLDEDDIKQLIPAAPEQHGSQLPTLDARPAALTR